MINIPDSLLTVHQSHSETACRQHVTSHPATSLSHQPSLLLSSWPPVSPPGLSASGVRGGAGGSPGGEGWLAGWLCDCTPVPGRGPNTTYTGLGAGCDNNLTTSSQPTVSVSKPNLGLLVCLGAAFLRWAFKNFYVEPGLQ